MSNKATAETWLRANAVDFTPQTLVDMTVEDIMREAKVPQRTAYEIRKVATAEIQSEGASHSLSQDILRILRNGPVTDIQALREALVFVDHVATPYDITKAVWSLQKRALVTFYEKKAGRDSILHKIKLTPRGMGEMGILPDRDDTRPSSVKGSKELKRRSPVGTDMTDPENQPSTTVGGPVERINGHATIEQEVIPATPYEAPVVPEVRYASPPPLAQNEKPESPKDPYRGFPLLRILADKKQSSIKLEQAAELLIDVDPETAQSLLDKIQLTELEKEYLAYAAAHGD